VEFGIRLRSLWHLKLWLLLCFLVAVLTAVWSVAHITLSPPSLTARKLQMATASTHVLVDSPSSMLIDLRENTYNIEGLRNRAVLLGNVAASSDVRTNIAKRVGIPVEALRIQPPLTREMTTRPADSENPQATSDILKSMDQYRLNLQSNPSVPMLDIYAQAPTAEMAAALANGAVDELTRHLERLAATQRTPDQLQVRLLNLGRAHGVVITDGVDRQVAVLVFLLTLGIGSATVIFLSRVRAGWRHAKLSEQAAASA
jgi:hypothetical protein